MILDNAYFKISNMDDKNIIIDICNKDKDIAMMISIHNYNSMENGYNAAERISIISRDESIDMLHMLHKTIMQDRNKDL